MGNIYPAASVIPLRDTLQGMETLLLLRNPALKHQGGTWVFPGGHIEDVDYTGLDSKDEISVARMAAIRETEEESGMKFNPDQLTPVARWTTPKGIPHRFQTWFFIAKADQNSSSVHVDGSEIISFQWLKPEEALFAHRKKEIIIVPPIFVNLILLTKYNSAKSAIDDLTALEPTIFMPKIILIKDGFCSLYQEDAGYESGQIDLKGPRHRLLIQNSEWHYEKSL